MNQPTTPPQGHRASRPHGASDDPDVHADSAEASAAAAVPAAGPLRRSAEHKALAGVCGGLGRYCDIDPVIFRIVVGVLSVTGGIGLVFYGFAWLLIPMEGEEENEARRLLSGRVTGASLAAVLMALVGCGLLLSMLQNDNMLSFAVLLSIAAGWAAYWSHRRRVGAPDGVPLDPAAAQAAAEAPPEATAPPVPESPSWWRDPIVKDGSTGPVPTGYLWGPEGAAAADDGAPLFRSGRDVWAAPRPPRGPRSIGGLTFLLALIAGGLGTALSWEGNPLGTSLQIGLVCALAVFGLGLLVSALIGRTGFGTVLLTVITAVLLAGAAALPKEISTHWVRTEWRPDTISAVQSRYELGTGVGTLDLSALTVPAGRTVSASAEVGAGQLRVVLPQDTPVTLDVEAGLGDIQLPGDAADDIDVEPGLEREHRLPAPDGARPSGTLELRLEVGIGQVEVTRAAP
ncbi:PspC domain-containing protein [Streptomyces sp. HNM0663]|uniref:PspC domain-containing protein n=1 Tax=Streptomyces chengmaiensis TaxID=3040919 RepID=A0ABT6HMI3_9ACTN|nr:PspC domain-containing protein [Streptomyces chengmaiensis]MDH2389492.1 PspC domain-containing protein [Streptomyces chengmaiensis]